MNIILCSSMFLIHFRTFKRKMTEYIPQPKSTPTIFGTILSITVIVVPIVQPFPAWTSGMIRIFEPIENG